MEPKITERKSFNIIGIKEHFKPEKENFERIWKKLERFNDQIKPLSIDNAYYGIQSEPDENGEMDYIAGIAVENVSGVPKELIIQTIPASRYAIFECTVKTIGETYRTIFGEWLPNSHYKYKKSVPTFELYPPNTITADDPVFIYIPIG
jgi:AraC family transcriptional regulator